MNTEWRVFQSARTMVAGILVAVCAVAPPASGGVDSGGTGARMASFSRGTIYGFGSIVVNGVRFDDADAAIVDDDDSAHPHADLKLGMSTDVEGGPVFTNASTGESSAVAHTVRFGSAIRGPVQAVNAGASSMTVFGQAVAVDHSTVFDGFANGFASVRVGQLIEVHANLDAGSARYTATRVLAAPQATVFKLRGVVSQLDTARRNFSIGQTRIDYAGMSDADMPVLGNGLVVKVNLRSGSVKGMWSATKAVPGIEPIPEEAGADIDGIVSGYTGLASFMLNGARVNASGAGVIFKNGTSGQVRNGVRAMASGFMRDGVLIASRIELKQSGTNNGGDEITLHGAIESVNASARNFVLRGNTVAHDDKTEFNHGSASALAVGKEVDVSGVLNASGTVVAAGKIKFGK